MKFRFCGDLDCPEWILAEIALLAKLTSIKMKLLCQNVISELIGYLSRLFTLQITKAEKILIDAKFDVAQIKGCIAAISFIFRSAVKHDCDATSLSTELLQLGLQTELCQQLCKVFEENLPLLRENIKKRVLKLQALQDCLITVNKDDTSSPYGVLSFSADSKRLNFALPSTTISLMRQDLEEAVKTMEAYETT